MKLFPLTAPVNRATFLRWFVVLALGDLVFIALNTALRAAMHFHAIVQVPDFLAVTADDSLPELYDYAKWAAICVLLSWVFLRTRGLIFLSFAVTFLLILVDDSLELHERFGGQIASFFGNTPLWGVRMQDFGELAVWAILGVVVVALLFEGFRRASDAQRALSMPLFYIFGGLLFAAVGLDFVHAFIDTLGIGTLSNIFGIFEDGSEMIVGSVACAYAIALAPISRSLRWSTEATTTLGR